MPPTGQTEPTYPATRSTSSDCPNGPDLPVLTVFSFILSGWTCSTGSTCFSTASDHDFVFPQFLILPALLRLVLLMRLVLLILVLSVLVVSVLLVCPTVPTVLVYSGTVLSYCAYLSLPKWFWSSRIF